MSPVEIVERELTDAEYRRELEGFNENDQEHGNPIETAERFSFAALCDGEFIGCSSCLAYKHENGYSNWAFLSDLFVERPFRNRGLGAGFLRKIEDRLHSIGVKYLYTWTAGYEAPEFYRKQGYQVFTELKDWYQSGHPRIGLWKHL